MNNITISIVYDSHATSDDFGTDWGFACVIQGMAKTILFDTGQRGHLLLRNLDGMKIQPAEIDLVVISHDHHDHTGGLMAFLDENSDVTVYLPRHFDPLSLGRIRETGAVAVTVGDPVEICRDVIVTGEPDGHFEQALFLRTPTGHVVVTGCAHPGLVRVVEHVKEIHDDPIRLAVGGFHMFRDSDDDVAGKVDSILRLGIEQIAPAHCTGVTGVELLQDGYGENFSPVIVGTVLTLENP